MLIRKYYQKYAVRNIPIDAPDKLGQQTDCKISRIHHKLSD